MTKRDAAWRMKIAASMRGNRNAAQSRFSEDLTTLYGDNPDVLAWIKENKQLLDAPMSDGSIPLSEDQIEALDGKFTYLE
jgi:hypothetical protein